MQSRGAGRCTGGCAAVCWLALLLLDPAAALITSSAALVLGPPPPLPAGLLALAADPKGKQPPEDKKSAKREKSAEREKPAEGKKPAAAESTEVPAVPPVWSAAPAPAPAAAATTPAPLPIIAQARERLKSDHRSLANASEQLLQVQDEIANMEDQLFGKVVGSDKVANLHAQHEATEAANARLQDDIQRLTEQIAGLSLQLAQLQRGYVTKGKEYRAHERQLRGEVVKNEATAESLDVELAKGRRVDAVHAELSQTRARLVDEGKRIAADGHAALKELAATKKAFAEEEGKAEALRRELLELHSLGENCHTNVANDAKKLAAKRALMPKATAAVVEATQHSEAAARAAEQRAAAEGVILRSEVLDAERDSQRSLLGLQDVQGRLRGLEKKLVEEVRGLNGRINSTKGQIKTTLSSLAMNTGVGTEDKARRHEVQVKLATLQREVSPVFYASLQAENDVYAAELEEILVNVTAANSEEANAEIDAQQAEAELAAQAAVEAENRKALEQAEAEAKRQVDEAREATAAKVAASKAVEQQAKDALAGKCSTKWLARKKVQDEALASCASQRAELSVINAQRDSLQATIQAQQVAAASA